MKLDKWDNLLIRACKSNGDSVRRLRKIWRYRCGLPSGYKHDERITYHLYKLLYERKQGLTIDEQIRILDRMNPEPLTSWYDKELSYNENLMLLLVSKIAITFVDQWDGFIVSARFREKG